MPFLLSNAILYYRFYVKTCKSTCYSHHIHRKIPRHSVNPLPSSGENQKGLFAALQLNPCKNTLAERSNWMGREGGDSDKS
jgi:hypothetical protein